MAIPRIPRRWRLQTLMIVVAFIAVGLGAYRVWVERGPVYRLIGQLRSGNAKARSGAALRIGLLGPRAAFAIKRWTRPWTIPIPMSGPTPCIPWSGSARGRRACCLSWPSGSRALRSQSRGG